MLNGDHKIKKLKTSYEQNKMKKIVWKTGKGGKFGPSLDT